MEDSANLITEMKNCFSCKTEIPQKAKFCKNCGVIQIAIESQPNPNINNTSLNNQLEHNADIKNRHSKKNAIILVGAFLLGLLVISQIAKKDEFSTNTHLDNQTNKEKSIENDDKQAIESCTLNVNKTVFDYAFNNGRIPASIEVIGFYIQAKMKLNRTKLDRLKQQKSILIGFSGFGLDPDSGDRVSLCVERVPLFFTDGSSEFYSVAYLHNLKSSKFSSIQPIGPSEHANLIKWYKKVAAENVRSFGSPSETSRDYNFEEDELKIVDIKNTKIDSERRSDERRDEHEESPSAKLIEKKSDKFQQNYDNFKIASLNAHSAKFTFRNQTYEVSANDDVDIRHAVIKKIITIIRQSYKGDFNWDSVVLGRVVILSARPEDNAGLENFLYTEFFSKEFNKSGIELEKPLREHKVEYQDLELQKTLIGLDEDLQLETYSKKILSLAKLKSYPRIAQMRGWQGEVLVKLNFDAQGHALDSSIEQSSGYSVLDSDALGKVRNIQSYPAVPNAFVGKSFSVSIPIKYSLE